MKSVKPNENLLQLIVTYVLLYVKLGYSAVISASVMVVMFPVQYFMSERLGKAHERALVRYLNCSNQEIAKSYFLRI